MSKNPSRGKVEAKYQEALNSFASRKCDVVASYFGELTKEKVNDIAYVIEMHLKETGVRKGIAKRIFSIIIEALQNIRLHGEKDSEGIQNSFVVAGSSTESFIIAIANLVDREKRSKIESWLQKINRLDRSALKELYLETLNDGVISSKGGAGLGLITIAMKSKNKLDYDFEPAGNDLSCFGLESRIMLN